MLSVGLNDDAGRAAYLTAFHAAQALIFERTGKVLKTHKGVQIEFLALTKNDLAFTADLRVFVSQAYNFKSIADYETDPAFDLSIEKASAAVESSSRFVEAVRSAIGR